MVGAIIPYHNAHRKYVLCVGVWGKLHDGIEVYTQDVFGTFSFDANYNTPSGELLRIDPSTETIEQRISLEAGTTGVKSRLSINTAGDKLYYLFGNGLYELDITANSASNTPLISGNFYGVGIDTNGNIYCSEADFTIIENNKIKKLNKTSCYLRCT